MSGFCLPQITPSLKSSPWLCLQKCWRDLPESRSLWLVRKAFSALGFVVKKKIKCTKLWPYWALTQLLICKGCDVGLRNVDQVIFAYFHQLCLCNSFPTLVLTQERQFSLPFFRSLKLSFLLPEPFCLPLWCWPNVGGVTRNLNQVCSVRALF